jgi:hypothetical protein
VQVYKGSEARRAQSRRTSRSDGGVGPVQRLEERCGFGGITAAAAAAAVGRRWSIDNAM